MSVKKYFLMESIIEMRYANIITVLIVLLPSLKN